MTSRERLETAWDIKEPDRVPIEINITEQALKHPRSERVTRFIDKYADNLFSVSPAQFGFLGLETTYNEITVKEEPGIYRIIERTHYTEAGVFKAATYHPEGNPDFRWEKRFINTRNELRNITDTLKKPVPYLKDIFLDKKREIGEKGLLCVSLLHPLGFLVRNSNMEETYTWFIKEKPLVHRFLEVTNSAVMDVIERMMKDGIGPYFKLTAHEMLIPPWVGSSLFDEFVFPYDKAVNDTIHRYGGKLRIHCHGSCMNYLEKFADMGVDAVEPLESAPMGDIDLALAKKKVGRRMMLSGNIPSDRFIQLTPGEVGEMVRQAIQAAAQGGGFTLRTTGGGAGTCAMMNDQQMDNVLKNCESYITAGLKYGRYPVV